MIWLTMLTLATGSIDLERIRAEPDPAKRAVKAIEYASQSLAQARDLVSKGEFDAAQEALGAMADAAELAREATQAKRHISSMKKVEQRSRDLLRRLDTLKLDFPFEDRESVEAIQHRIQKVQEDVLASIMGRRK